MSAPDSRASSMGAPEAWRPIETAPKCRMLALVDGRVRIVAWGKASHVPWQGYCLADQGPEDFDLCEPTHWMPLPAAPGSAAPVSSPSIAESTDEWAGYKERCEHGVRWENRCSSCDRGAAAPSIALELADAQMLLAWMDETFGNEDGTDWQDEDAAAVGDALNKAVENFKRMRAAVMGEEAKPSEPVAFMWQHEETGNVGFVGPWQVENGWQAANPRLRIVSPLYASPSPAVPLAALRPLKEEDIIDATEQIDMNVPGCFIRIARAVERAHGIGSAALPAPLTAEQDAWSDVLTERQKQRARWGDDHDDEHGHALLALQACSYLMPGQSPLKHKWAYKSKVEDRDPRRVQLVKGVALALAALEAHDRAALSAPLTAEQRNRWRKCEFCGCNTNAAARACCNKGRQADAALPAGGEQEGRA